jgi:hypothetical protein
MASTVPGEARDAQELKEEIEQTRESLGATVEQLVALADVKARAKAEASRLAGRVKSSVSDRRGRAAAQAESARGSLASRARTVRDHPAARVFAVVWVVSFAGLAIWQRRKR